jgi:phosphocarrier protein
VQKGKQKVNGKSIMGLMMLAAGSGSQVTIDIKGPDAEQAMAVVEKLFASGFGEE